MKDKIWNLFKLTGDIKYYMLYKEMEIVSKSADIESKRNSNNWYKL